MTAHQTVAHGIGIQALPDGATPCWSCGLPVPGDGDIPFTILAMILADGRVEDALSPVTLTLAECDACHRLREGAAAIVAQHPALRRLGSPSIIRDRLTRALRALAAVGQEPPADWSLEAVHAALTRLVDVGQALAWSNRYSPVRQADARLDEAASEPYLYASADVMAQARREVASFLRDQLPPRPIDCPSGGCLVCGRSSHLGRREQEAWVPVTSGKHRGHLCATCARHYGGQVIGQTLIDAALLDHIDSDGTLRRRTYRQPQFRGVRLWADTGRKPSTRPWAHVDLDALEHELRHGTW